MIVTEEEARSKWCQETHFRGDARYNCIGRQCASWCWTQDATHQIGKRTIIVEAMDIDLLDGAMWSGHYVRTREGDYLHKLIMERVCKGPIPKGMLVDHWDGDTLNYRRGNLRLATPAQNAANAAARGGKSKYRGVWESRPGRWSSQIAKAGMRLSLGTFDTEEEAAAAYDRAAADIHGEFARLNLSVRVNSGRRGFCGKARG